MLTLTQAALDGQAQAFLDRVTHGRYKLNGNLVENVQLFKKERTGSTVRIYIMMNLQAAGVISEIQLQAKDGTVLATSDEVLQKPEARGIYSTFKYKFTEQEVING